MIICEDDRKNGTLSMPNYVSSVSFSTERNGQVDEHEELDFLVVESDGSVLAAQ